MYDIQALRGAGSVVPGQGATYPFGLNAVGGACGVDFAVLGDPENPTYTEVGAVWNGGNLVFTQPWNPQNNSCLYSINRYGDASGVRAVQNSMTQLADVVRGAIVRDLGPTVGAGSVASHINDAGLACGWCWGSPEAFVYDTRTGVLVSQIDPLPGAERSVAIGMNSSGRVVGTSGRNGFCFAGGVLTDLGPAVFVMNVNDAGTACGSVGRASPENFGAAICDTTKAEPAFVEIPLPPGFTGGHADGINNHGAVVGSCWMPGNINQTQSAYICENGASTDLNSLIGVPGWHLEYATDINDSGQIIGYGTYNGEHPGFLLTPAGRSPHSQWGLVGSVFGGVGVDGGGWIYIGGHRIPVGPWGLSEPAAQPKRDALLALALDELAMYIADDGARATVRRALIEVAQERLQTLTKSVTQGHGAASTHARAAAAPAAKARSRSLRDGKSIELLRRLGTR